MSNKLPPPALLYETRFKCIADYPRNMQSHKATRLLGDAEVSQLCPHYSKGDIIITKTQPEPSTDKLPRNYMNLSPIWNEETENFLSTYPALFRRLEWYEHRTIEELCSVRFVLILTNDHPIYNVGDQVRVKDYSIFTKPLKFDGYMLYDYYPDNIIRVKDCMPTSEHLLTPKI